VCADEIAGPVKWLGETIGFWVQTFILFISALAATWVIRSSKTQEKRRATIDVVMHQKSDDKLIEARSVLLGLLDRGEGNFAKYLESTSSKEYKSILLVLNGYEFVGSGVREGAFDENTYKRLRHAMVLRDWDNLSAFVLAFRRQKSLEGLFQEFEWLVRRWRKSPLKTDHN